MNIENAKEILRTLADGINPVTGEVLSSEDSCNQPDVIRALYTILEQLNLKSTKNKSDNLPENAGKPWNTEDDELLRDLFNSGQSIKELAPVFKRTEGSICSRLERLGLIERHYNKH